MILDEMKTINVLLSNYCRRKILLRSLVVKVPIIIGNLIVLQTFAVGDRMFHFIPFENYLFTSYLLFIYFLQR